MTKGAVGREARRDVLGISGAGKVLGVARIAIRRQLGAEVAVEVTRGAGQGRVRAGERESRVVVIEGGWDPGAGGVADGTICREARGNVIGIGGACEVLLMAAIAARRNAGVIVVDVALSAGQGEVRAGERVVRVEGVVKLGVEPVGIGMTRVAGVG